MMYKRRYMMMINIKILVTRRLGPTGVLEFRQSVINFRLVYKNVYISDDQRSRIRINTGIQIGSAFQKNWPPLKAAKSRRYLVERTNHYPSALHIKRIHF